MLHWVVTFTLRCSVVRLVLGLGCERSIALEQVRVLGLDGIEPLSLLASKLGATDAVSVHATLVLQWNTFREKRESRPTFQISEAPCFTGS